MVSSEPSCRQSLRRSSLLNTVKQKPWQKTHPWGLFKNTGRFSEILLRLCGISKDRRWGFQVKLPCIRDEEFGYRLAHGTERPVSFSTKAPSSA